MRKSEDSEILLNIKRKQTLFVGGCPPSPPIPHKQSWIRSSDILNNVLVDNALAMVEQIVYLEDSSWHLSQSPGHGWRGQVWGSSWVRLKSSWWPHVILMMSPCQLCPMLTGPQCLVTMSEAQPLSLHGSDNINTSIRESCPRKYYGDKNVNTLRHKSVTLK